MNIGAVEFDTGLSKDILRVWERRYGFPLPVRDALGERDYSVEQVDKLRLLKRLLDRGHRPGKIIHNDLAALSMLEASFAQQQAMVPAEQAALQIYLDLCARHRPEELRSSLSHALSRMGLERFIVELLAPLTWMVGEAWAQGTLRMFEEHLYTESVQTVLRKAISAISYAHDSALVRPRILLTTFPQEQHGLGLLMAEAILAQEGARCISLGLQTPIAEIVHAASVQDIDIVALSFSASMNSKQALSGLAELRAQLPEKIALWAGGSCALLSRRAPSGARVFNHLSEIHAALEDWQKQRVQ